MLQIFVVCFLVCLACLCFRMEQPVYWCAWLVCVSGCLESKGVFSIAYFPSFVCLLVCLACLCFRMEQPVYWCAWLVCVSGCLESNRKVQHCLFP